MENNKKIEDIIFEKSNGVGTTTYLTHNFHVYPAKFIPQLPHKTILTFTKEGDVVLDPFCGCGTTLVEAKLLNRHSIGIDLNPIAILASKAKTNKFNDNDINIVKELIPKIEIDIYNHYKGIKTINYDIPIFYNIYHWFQKNVLNELGIIKAHIENVRNDKVKYFMKTAFSSIIVIVSNQESDTRYAAINKNIENYRTFNEFSKKINDMLYRIADFSKKASDMRVETYTENSENMHFLEDNTIDHIMTSPPYANTYDYYLYHKFRMYWLGYDVKKVQKLEIGSRNRHSSKKENISIFIDSLEKCMTEMNRVLKRDKYAVVVIGDCVIKGDVIKADDFMKDISQKTGFEIVRKISYNQKDNTKLFNPKFTNGDKLEHILFLRNVKK